MAHNYGRAGAAGKARARSRTANHLYYRMTSLLSRLRHHLSRTRLLAEPGTAVLAGSGCSDSAPLLDLFHALAPRLALNSLSDLSDPSLRSESRVVAGAGARLVER